MRILVLGANGLLGSNIVYAGRKRDWNVCGTYHSTRPGFNIPLSEFSLELHDQFSDILDAHDPDIVVNCAAMTDVDACERNPEQAYALNGRIPGHLMISCAQASTDFVHISTDYVFDGDTQSPYTESAEPNPIQVYGESKLAGEQAVQAESASVLLPRLSFVWGLHRGTGDLTGFPAWVCDRLQAGDPVRLFTDQWITPTRAGQAAETILDLIEQGSMGHCHIACRSCTTPYEFGEALAERIDADTRLLNKGTLDEIERDAERPTYSCLAVETVESTLDRAQPTMCEDIGTIWDGVH